MFTEAEQDVLECIVIRILTELEAGIKADTAETGECRGSYLLARDQAGVLENWLAEKRYFRKKENQLSTLERLQEHKNKTPRTTQTTTPKGGMDDKDKQDN